MNTKYYKDHDKKWAGKTSVSMPNNMELSIHTLKGINNVITIASVSHIPADGSGLRTVLFNDFNVHLAPFKASRVTEKVIKEAHETALLRLENVKLEVIAFYKARPELIQRPDVTE